MLGNQARERWNGGASDDLEAKESRGRVLGRDRPFQRNRENHREHDRIGQADGQCGIASRNAADDKYEHAKRARDGGEYGEELRCRNSGQQRPFRTLA